MKTKKRVVILSVLTLMLCLALVAGGTFALFTDDVTLGNHLQAGKLNITLERIELTVDELGAEGFITPVTKQARTDVAVDFSETKTFAAGLDNNVFGVVADELIAPMAKRSAVMKITNNSDVAFGYWIEIVLTSTDNNLADQIKVTVLVDGTEHGAGLNSGLIVGDASNPIEVLAVAEAQEFTVIVEFVNGATNDPTFDNNLAQGQEVSFDLVVHAVQETDSAKN